MKFTCFYCDSTVAGIQYSSVASTVVMKFTCFYCDSTADGSQYSSIIADTVIIKFTCFYCDSAADGNQYSSHISTVTNKHTTIDINYTVLYCKYSAQACFIIFKSALADINSTVGSNNCTTNESIIRYTTILWAKYNTFSV